MILEMLWVVVTIYKIVDIEVSVYLVDILILIIVCCIFSEFSFNKNEIEYMNNDNTGALQGIGSVVVILHHLSQQGIETMFLNGLLESGKYSVAIFFAISGYGLTYSAMHKKEYMNHFLYKKLTKIVIPYIIVTMVYYLTYVQLGRDMSFRTVISNFIFTGRPIIENSWYILIIILLYVSFYLLYRKTKTINSVLVGILEISFFVMVIIRYVIHWQEYWYNSILCFPVGMAICLLSKMICKQLEEHYWMILFASFLLELSVHVGKFFFKSVWFDIIGLVLFVICIFLIMIKLKYKGWIWKKISTISLELYLVHRLVYTVFRSEMVYIESDLLYVLFTLIISIVSACLLRKSMCLIIRWLESKN